MCSVSISYHQHSLLLKLHCHIKDVRKSRVLLCEFFVGNLVLRLRLREGKEGAGGEGGGGGEEGRRRKRRRRRRESGKVREIKEVEETDILGCASPLSPHFLP